VNTVTSSKKLLNQWHDSFLKQNSLWRHVSVQLEYNGIQQNIPSNNINRQKNIFKDCSNLLWGNVALREKGKKYRCTICNFWWIRQEERSMLELLFNLGKLSDSSQHQRISRTKSIHSTAIAGIKICLLLIKLKKLEENSAQNTHRVCCSCQTTVHADRTGQKANLKVPLS
jgi:hypothetical protein